MYIFVYFVDQDIVSLYQLIIVYFFGLLVLYMVSGLDVNYFFCYFDFVQGVLGMLYLYVVCVNLLWCELVDGDEVLVVFLVGDVYILLSWYFSKYEVYCQVLIWNYSVVYVYGCVIICDDECYLCGVVVCLICIYEVGEVKLWKMFDVFVDYIDILFKVIVGIEIEIMCLEGKCKFSQNKEVWDIEGVGRVLVECGYV